MTLLNKKRILKDKFNNVKKITSATMSTETENDNNVYKMYLNLDGVFKLLQIDYIGQIAKINSIDNSLRITHNDSYKKIIISNPNKTTLKNDFLLEYTGEITDFKKIKVFGWKQGHIMATKTTPSLTSQNISKNENVVSTSDHVF